MDTQIDTSKIKVLKMTQSLRDEMANGKVKYSALISSALDELDRYIIGVHVAKSNGTPEDVELFIRTYQYDAQQAILLVPANIRSEIEEYLNIDKPTPEKIPISEIRNNRLDFNIPIILSIFFSVTVALSFFGFVYYTVNAEIEDVKARDTILNAEVVEAPCQITLLKLDHSKQEFYKVTFKRDDSDIIEYFKKQNVEVTTSKGVTNPQISYVFFPVDVTKLYEDKIIFFDKGYHHVKLTIPANESIDIEKVSNYPESEYLN